MTEINGLLFHVFLLLRVISCIMGFLIDLGQVGHSLFYLHSLEM
jgi:hypothetical protein